MANPLKLFVSYSHKDQEQLDELVKYLKTLVDVGKIEPWTDRLLEIGSRWDSVIKDNLSSADIIILLISIDFIHSEYISTTELVAAKQRHEEKAAKVIPILLTHCPYQNYWFSEIQGLPEGMVPLSAAKDENEISKAYTNIIGKIEELADELVKDKKLKPYEKLASDMMKVSINGEFSPADISILSHEQSKLGLTDEEVNEIKNRLLDQHREKSNNCQTYIDCYVKYVNKYGRELSQTYIEQLKRLQERLQITDQECNNLQSQIKKRVKEEEECKARDEEAKPNAEAERLASERPVREQQVRDQALQQVLKQAQNPQPDLQTLSISSAVLVQEESRGLKRLFRPSWRIDRGLVQAKVYQQPLAEGPEITMVQIPAGSFQMGSPDTEAERQRNEGPQHRVELQSFFLGQTPITQAQWQAVASWPQVEMKLNSDPAEFKFEGSNKPVDQVSWEEAMEFCRRLSQRSKLVYTLPSEAQWEYACRAGTTTPFHFGDTVSTELANYIGIHVYGDGDKGEWRLQTTDVASFPANPWGLHDMHGNVCEWCLDPWHDSYRGAPADGSAWTAGGGVSRLLRGGSWESPPADCRSASRDFLPPDARYNGRPVFRDFSIGFRVCCLPQD